MKLIDSLMPTSKLALQLSYQSFLSNVELVFSLLLKPKKLIKFGLRNRVRLEVTGNSDALVDSNTASSGQTAASATLANNFVVIGAAYNYNSKLSSSVKRK